MKRVAINENILDAFLPMDFYGKTALLSLPGSFALGITMENGEEDEPVGLIVCTEDEDRLVIEWIYVMPEYRGDGLGSELLYLAFCEGEARGFVDAVARVSDEYEANDYGWSAKSFFENDVFSGTEKGESDWRISFRELEKKLMQDEEINETSARKVIRLCDMDMDDLKAAAEAMVNRFDESPSLPLLSAIRISNPKTSFLLKNGNDYAGILLIRQAEQTWYPYLMCAVDDEARETLIRAALYCSEDVCMPKDEILIAIKTISTRRLLQKIGLPGQEYDVTFFLCSMRDFTKRKAEVETEDF